MPVRIRSTHDLGLVLAAAIALLLAGSGASASETWRGDLAPLDASAWQRSHAAHLLERAGFGGTPDEIERLAALGPSGAVKHMLHADPGPLPPFEHSGVHDPLSNPSLRADPRRQNSPGKPVRR